MSVKAVKAYAPTAHKPVSATRPKSKSTKTMKLTYYYDESGKQLGRGDYYTSNYGLGNTFSYDSISHMDKNQLAKIGIRKVVKEFSYIPEPPAPKKEVGLLEKIMNFILA